MLTPQTYRFWSVALLCIAITAFRGTVSAQCTNLTTSLPTITPPVGCSYPRAVAFTNLSTGTLAATTTYSYRIVGGAIFDSVVNTLPRTYMAPGPGTYTIRMIARTPGGCVDSSKTRAFTVTGGSLPRIYDGNGTPSTAPIFRNCILNPAGPNAFQVDLSSPNALLNYTIIWGDTTANNTGVILTAGGMVSHTYNNLNQYTIKIARDSLGCKDTITGTVFNFRPPNASILPITGGTYVGCAPLNITYKDSSVYAFPGTTLTWDFGVPGGVFVRDYTRANDTIQFTYPLSTALATCPKTISLTINNPQCGSPITNTKSGEVNVYNKSQAAITLPTPLCTASRTYTFTNSSVNNCVGSDKYFWRTADTTIGWTSSKAPVTITFPGFGNQFIRLIDSNACGIDSITIPIIISRTALAGFTANPKIGCAPLSVTYTDTSIGIGNGRAWTFGTGSGIANRTDSTFTVIYNNTGTFTTNLTVSNSQCPGNNSANTSIQVYGKPSITITGAVNGCVPHTVNLNSTVANIRTSSAQYLWKFKGGDTSTQKIPPAILYNTPGVDTVWLIVSDTCGTDSSFRVIRISTLPVASFTSTSVCRGDSTAFTNTSTLASGDVITAYKWYFRGTPNDSSTASAPKYVYNTDGVFQAILRITTDKSCVDFDTAAVNVKIAPKLNIVSSPAILCDTGVVVFTGDTTGSGSPLISYQWTFGGSITDTARGKDTSYRFPSPATYVVTYKVNNSINCSTTTTKNITVNPLPDARLVASNLCFGQFTQFFDSSTVTNANTITQWQWDFNNDGTPDSITKNPRYPFPSASTFKVKLRVGTNNNCFNTDSISVTVNPLPGVAASSGVANKCKLDSFTFNNTTTGANSYRWVFGDGTDSTTSSLSGLKKAYVDTGAYAVKMIATTALGCKDSTSLSVNSRPFPVARFTVNDTLSCAPKTFTFTNTSILADNYIWRVNGNNTSVATSRPDTLIGTSGQSFVVGLIATTAFGCRPDTAQKTLQTINNPNPIFTTSIDSGCGPLDVNFTNGSSGATSYQWILGNGISNNSIHTSSTYVASILNDSTYQVKLIAFNGPGCKDSLSKTIKVFPKPISNFTQNQTANCGPLPVTFTNTSNHKFGGTIDSMTFRWRFGNGDTAVAKNPVEVFMGSAVQDTNYTIRLIATSRYGCSDTSQSTLRVFPKPKANFLANNDNGCGPLPVSFTNTSVPNDTGNISIMAFNWNFRNGVTSTQQDTTARFVSNATKDTIYQVQLIALSEHGCVDTVYKDIRVYPKPRADFVSSSTNGCTPFTASFTNTSTPYDTGSITIMSFVWDMGNGFNSIVQDAASQYTSQPLADSTYTIKLFATSEHGCKDTTQKQIVSHPLPIASFTNNVSQGCGPFTVQFNSTSLLASTYKWYFGDGDSALMATPPHVFQSYPLVDSVYPIKLMVRSVFGCASDTARGNIIGRYLPDVDFISSADSICSSGTIAFTNQSLGGVSNSWNFGNGITSPILNPISLFTGLADRDTTYQIRLIVTTPYTCKDTAFKSVKVNPLPTAQFASITPGCTPLNTVFTNTSLRAQKYEWDFGDGTTDTIALPSKEFVSTTLLSTRDFVTTLKAISISGCTDTAKQIVRVYPQPISVFTSTLTDGCGPLTIPFNNQSTSNFTGSLGMTFDWDFANGNSSAQKTPTATFMANAAKDTFYSVSLIAISEFGCRDTSQKTIQVYPKPKSLFTATDTSGCSPLMVSFTNGSYPNDTGSIAIMNFVWNFANGFSSVTQNATSQFTNTSAIDTTYAVKLFATSEHGCKDTAQQNIAVHPQPTASFTVDKNSGCGPFDVLFTNTSINNATNRWFFGDNDSTGILSPTHTYQSYSDFDTIYEASLITRSAFGCVSDTARKSITGRYLPQAIFTTSNDSTCNPGNISFYNASIGGASNNWNFGNGNTSNAVNPVITFSGPITRDTTYTISLIVTSPATCKDTAYKNIKVNPVPDASFANVVPACTPYPVSFANTSQRAVSYEWDFGDASTDVAVNPSKTFTNDVALADKNFQVLLKAYSSSGCMDTAKRNITVYPLPLVNYTLTKTTDCDTAEYSLINSTQGAFGFLWKQSDQIVTTQFAPKLYFRTSLEGDTNYTVRLIATTNQGCKDSLTKPLTVKPLVRAAFVSTGGSNCSNVDVDFTNLSKNALSYFWLFGDGTGSPATTPSHRYNSTGSYNVALIVYDAFGCTDTATKNNHVNVFEVPTANFISSPPDIALPNSTIQFTNMSFISGGSLTHHWNFGDPASSSSNESTELNPSHTFSDSGNFATRLVVRSNNGCYDTLTNTVRIKPHPPEIDFTFDPPQGCSPLTVKFTNTSLYADTFEWTFDDGQKSTLKDPEITFRYPGKYGAFLRGTGPGGIGQVRKDAIIEVFALPRANFYATPLNLVLPNSTVSLVDLSSDAVAWKWRISLDGRTYFTDSSRESGYTFPDEGKYSVTLIAMSKDGCLHSLTRPELVHVIKGGKLYVGSAFTPNNDGVNDKFKPYLQGVLDDEYLFEVYDRWGSLVFSTNDKNGSWDGTFAGQPSTTGVFVWIVKGRYVGNFSFTEKGNVTLIR
ncbi:MAG: PKD domain-containing protein [Bacteroidota bacterium]